MSKEIKHIFLIVNGLILEYSNIIWRGDRINNNSHHYDLDLVQYSIEIAYVYNHGYINAFFNHYWDISMTEVNRLLCVLY